MTPQEFSRAAGRLMNAPYWYEHYTGTDPAECVKFRQERMREKSLFEKACANVESVRGTLEDLPADARLLWNKADGETRGK